MESVTPSQVDQDEQRRLERVRRKLAEALAVLESRVKTGAARYRSPQGVVEGDIERKRQYRIRNGRTDLMLEGGISILHDALPEPARYERGA
jgi:hypothetical protein